MVGGGEGGGGGGAWVRGAGVRGFKPNCHNPGLGAPILYKLPVLPPEGQEYKFLLRNPRVLLALVQTLLTCVTVGKKVRDSYPFRV